MNRMSRQAELAQRAADNPEIKEKIKEGIETAKHESGVMSEEELAEYRSDAAEKDREKV